MHKWPPFGLKEHCLLKPKVLSSLLCLIIHWGPDLMIICSNTHFTDREVESWRWEVMCSRAYCLLGQSWDSTLGGPVPSLSWVCLPMRLVPALPCSRWVELACQGFPFFFLGFPSSSSPSTLGVCDGGGVTSVSSPPLDIPEVSVCMCGLYQSHRGCPSHFNFWIPCLLRAKTRPDFALFVFYFPLSPSGLCT